LQHSPRKLRNICKNGNKNVHRFAKSKKRTVEARTNVEVPKIFELLVGVARQQEAVQVLHLCAANVGTKMAEIFYFQTFYKNFLNILF
jgi:hypothetical protein